ncbi:hypothetical protein BgiBS90_021522 [Biomphalaria glabrata]|nr:hypothetical protein BgiBS90_021522 [Biomphalaria glabrata]
MYKQKTDDICTVMYKQKTDDICTVMYKQETDDICTVMYKQKTDDIFNVMFRMFFERRTLKSVPLNHLCHPVIEWLQIVFRNSLL